MTATNFCKSAIDVNFRYDDSANSFIVNLFNNNGKNRKATYIHFDGIASDTFEFGATQIIINGPDSPSDVEESKVIIAAARNRRPAARNRRPHFR